MTTNDTNRAMTIKERYLNFKEENTDKELESFLNFMEKIEERPTNQNMAALESMKRSVDDRIEQLPPEDRELIERLYHHTLFKAKKEEETGYPKWDFFKDTARENGWSAVNDLIDIIEKNEERHDKIYSGGKGVSETVLKEHHKKDEADLKKLEKILKNEVLPWAKENLSTYYQDLIRRTMENRLRIIRNRLNRGTELGFAKWLSETRKAKGMTLQEVADKSNTSTSYIQRLEKGKRKAPSLPIIQDIARAMNVPYHEVVAIVGGEVVKDEKLLPLHEVVERQNYLLQTTPATIEQKQLLSKLIQATLNLNGRSAMDNIIDIPNIVREIQASVDQAELEEMTDLSDQIN